LTPLALALLVPCLAGLAIARRLFGLGHWLSMVPVGLTSGCLLTAMTVNLILRAGGSFESAMVGSIILIAVLGAVCWLVGSEPKPEKVRLSLWTAVYLVFMSGLVYFTSVSILFLNPDDDFWLHAPMQAQLLKGNFPIRNPVFPHLSYGGHYARDLCMVMFSWFSGLNLYAVQAPVTAFFQVNAFWLIFVAGLRYGRSQWAAVLTSLFVFMGVNAAGRGGWLDTVGNNNPIAQVHTALLLFLFVRVLFEEVSWGQVVGTGVLFAGLAWSYETNFVALSLALLAFAAIVAAKREMKKKQLAITGVIVAVSLVFLVLQGGLFGELFTKLIGGGPTHEVQTDESTQAQNLEVSVKFPKEKIFQIKLARAGDEISLAYHTFPWFKEAFDISPQEPGYVSVFSPVVWRIHWLSLYLCPLVFLVLWRYNNKLGFLFWGYGFAAYILPAVVDFGIWEVEVFRWEYAASWGFAGAFGVALGEWLASLQGPVFTLDRKQVTISRNLLLYLAAAGVVFLNCYPTWVQVERRTGQLPSPAQGFLLPSTRTWMEYHPVLGMMDADVTVGMKLAPKVRKGEAVLVSRRADSPDQLLQESAFVGLFGGQTVGHAFPLQSSRVGTKPFRKSAPALAFWASGDPDLLRNWDLKWLFVKEDRMAPKITQSEGLIPVIQEPSESGKRVVYESMLKPFPEPELVEEPDPSIRLENLAPLDQFGTEEYRQIEFQGEVPIDTLLTYRFYDPKSGEEVSYEEGLTQTLGPDWFHFVSPHNPGSYLVKLFAGTAAQQRQVGQFTFDTVQLEAFQKLQVQWANASVPIYGGLVQKAELEFYNPTDVRLRMKGLLGLTGIVEGQLAPRDFQTLDVQVGPGERKVLDVRLVPPKAGGSWPFELVLSPKDGLRTFTLEPRLVIY
jgi:hypothetical protein